MVVKLSVNVRVQSFVVVKLSVNVIVQSFAVVKLSVNVRVQYCSYSTVSLVDEEGG